MNGNGRPSTDEIRHLSNSNLIDRFIKDTSHRSHYELEIYKRLNDKKLNLLLLDPAPSYILNDVAVSSIRDIWRAVRNSGRPIRIFVEELQKTGWDYTDPARRVKMPPDEVREFLQAFMYYRDDEYYDQLPDGMKNLLGMCYDAYCRWQMRQDQTSNRQHSL